MATLHKISMPKAQYDALILSGKIIPTNYQIFISDAPTGTPNIVNGDAQVSQASASVPTTAVPIQAYNTYQDATSIDWTAVRQALAIEPTLGAVLEV